MGREDTDNADSTGGCFRQVSLYIQYMFVSFSLSLSLSLCVCVCVCVCVYVCVCVSLVCNFEAHNPLRHAGFGRDSDVELYVMFKHWLDTLDDAETIIDYSDYLPPVIGG